jgi:hypothetical protein
LLAAASAPLSLPLEAAALNQLAGELAAGLDGPAWPAVAGAIGGGSAARSTARPAAAPPSDARETASAAALGGAATTTLAGQRIGADDPHTIDLLECLDDAVYEAISGDAVALEKVEVLWPLVLEQLGPQQVEPSRQHYLHYALTIWSAAPGSRRRPERAVAALDVLSLLFGEPDTME